MEYEPIARLGRGGMGVVDLARDREGNQVALKRLTLHGSAREVMRARQRLLREAKVLRRLRHPNVVRLLDVVEDDDDEIVLVMPYLPGGSLADRVAQHGPAPPVEIERLGRCLLGALAEAHAAGVIHRDIKPANVLYDTNGQPCLADFGLAYTWDQSEALTMAGMVVGTPGFIAPEQARGEPLTPASDIFSLGATLLFAATGGGPFGTGDPGLLMVRAAAGKVEKVPKRLPAPLRRRLQRMLDPRPERRPTAATLLMERTDGRGWRPPAAAVLGGVAATVLVATVVIVGASGDGSSGDATAPDGAGETPDGGPVPPGQGGDDPSQDPGTYPDDDDGGFGDDEDTDGELLIEELQGVLTPDEDLDAYPMPLEPPGDCSRQVELHLMSRGEQDLRLVVYRNDDPVGEATTSGDEPATVTLHPADCSTEEIVVEVLAGPASPNRRPAPQPYVLRRVDTP